jgi:ABC-2 type transport system ATP-binding protein
VSAISGLPAVIEVTVDGRLLRARVRDGAAAIPGVIAALEQRGLHVASATIARPSLDDVYLRHTGRSFEQAEADLKEVAA